ncbi:glycosyltransferase [Sphingomonas sp. MMS24-J45]|uniref:glycosyltransferase n=1 Tax=Sphingomonas sp. MMS24-J45 TaxID=3238806 RepID=UPI00384F710E
MTRPLRIALFTPDLRPSAGGPPRVVLGSAQALVARGHTVTIFTLAVAALASPGVEICCFPADRPARIGRSRAMRQAAQRRIADFDALHVHAIWEAGAADLAAVFRAAGKPVIVSAHGMLDRWSMAQSRLNKAVALRLWTGSLLSRATAIVFATDEEAAEASALHPKTPRAIVANGIDIAATEAAVEAGLDGVRSKVPGLSIWPRTIVYLSRLHPKKGVDQLVEARLALDARFDDVGLLIAGIPQDDGLLQAMRSRIAESPLRDRITLTTDLIGPVAIGALGAAHLFVLPSHQEGFSIAILEAMAAGLPVLITDKCHLPEIEAWEAGAVVPDTVDGVKAGLERLLSLPAATLANMGEKARNAVERHYGWPVIAGQLEALYHSGRSPR